MKMSDWLQHIYILCDPTVTDPISRVRYVGATRTPKRRLQLHLSGKTNPKKAEWIRNLKVAGLAPEMVVIERQSVNLCFQELAWIVGFRTHGADLFNGRTTANPLPGQLEAIERVERHPKAPWNSTDGDVPASSWGVAR